MKIERNFAKKIVTSWIVNLKQDPKKFIRCWTPRCFLNRALSFLYTKRNPGHPWLTQEANSIPSTLLKPTDVGLEWGSGSSTLWFAQRIKHLTSVEHDESYYKAVSNKLKVANISNVDYLLCKVAKGKKPEKSSYVQVVNAFGKDSIDFVLIDGVCRDICANRVLEKIRLGGICVIDNVNWYLPSSSISPFSIAKTAIPASEE